MQEQRVPLGGTNILMLWETSVGWQIWLNNIHDFDGIHLASAPTRAAAIDAATERLLEGVRTLRALNPDAVEISDPAPSFPQASGNATH